MLPSAPTAPIAPPELSITVSPPDTFAFPTFPIAPNEKMSFVVNIVGDYWANSENRSNIELGKHRHRKLFLSNAALGLDLEDGYGQFENEHGSERLEGILAFIIKTARPGVPLKEMLRAEFVCRRGLLRNLSINNNCHTFITFHAIRHRGIIFLCEDKNIGDAPDKLRRAMYYNLKFENVVTTPASQARSVTAQKREETKTVIHATIEKAGAEPIRVYYAAEIDCLDQAGEGVELKTISKPLESGWDKSRSMAWYMQCFFGNVKKIVVGQRQRNRLRAFRFVDVASIRQNNCHNWTVDACLDQLHTTLAFVKQYMTMDGMSLKFTTIHGCTYVATSALGQYIVPENFLREFPF